MAKLAGNLAISKASKLHKIRIRLFNWTKQDKKCKFSRKSSF